MRISSALAAVLLASSIPAFAGVDDRNAGAQRNEAVVAAAPRGGK